MEFRSAHPIGATDVMALPVKEIGPAIGYYTKVLGLKLAERQENRAVLVRDGATIGLAVNGLDPEQASVYFEMSDVEAYREELLATGIEPGPIRVDDHGGSKYRVFFAKEPYGVCFCFGQKQG